MSKHTSVSLSHCSGCQHVCTNCKSICVNCKSFSTICLLSKVFISSSTDTDDFDKYLESISKKLKALPKVKTVSTDTCDLESHFDYYTFEKKVVRIQKSVATDCTDLIARKILTKKGSKKTVATDTNDLIIDQYKIETTDESDCEFFWTQKDENKTYSKKPISEQGIVKNNAKQSFEDSGSSSLLSHEETSKILQNKEKDDNKENLNINNSLKDVSFDSSTSDESDIDLITSCKVTKYRKLAKKFNLTLKQSVISDKLKFLCSICETKFPKKYLGILHLGSHIENNKYKCLSCNELFTQLELLLFHHREVHITNKITNEKTEITIQSTNVKNDKQKKTDNNQKQKLNKIYKCTLCSNENESVLTFNTFKALFLHKKIKHGVGNSKVRERSSKAEKKIRIKQEFICLICGKQFKSSKALKDHSPVHTGEKNYHCDICNKSYTTSANLKIHKRTHTGAKNFICSVCNKAFHKKDSLKVHFRKHSGERPFQCDLCPMKFDRNYILKNHRYTHFSEKTFICPICGKTFTTHGGLNNHEKGHKKDPFLKKPRKPAVKPTLDAENAVICDVCGKIYSTKSNLRIHKFVHLGVKPFECTICHQTYAKKDSMLTHMRKHTDERPFACETCGMTFYRNHTLKTHLLRHTGERPHKCKMCGKSFTQSSSLAYHVKNHDKKIEKRKFDDEEPKPRKKKTNLGSSKNSSVLTKKAEKIVKPCQYQTLEVKSLFEEKRPISGEAEILVIKDSSISLPDKVNEDNTKTENFTLSVPEKEILILDKSLGIEVPRTLNTVKDVDMYGDGTFSNQYNLSKFNYYVAKSHVFSFSKDSGKQKTESSVDKSEVENVIVSKNSFITKEGGLISVHRDANLKEIKEGFTQIEEDKLDLKPQMAIPITGEILNATFISDENGDVVPFSSMPLHGLNSENFLISPVIPMDNDDRKGFLRNSKMTMLNSKITYNLAASRLPNDKILPKGGCTVINFKDPRITQKLHIELEQPGFHIQDSVVEDDTLHGISGYYSNIQQNEI